MPLTFRQPMPNELPRLEEMIIDAFANVTWFRRADELFGPQNGMDWRERWKLRLKVAFARETLLVGEDEGETVAFASGNYDFAARTAYIDLLAVDPRRQGQGYGREMLRGIVDFFKREGAQHVHLECLTTNDAGNRLYESEGFTEVARSIRWWKNLT